MILAANSAYDPDAPEGSKPRGSDYISRKDLLWIGGIVLVLGVMFIPIYRHMLEDSQRTACKRNLNAISKAVFGYAEAYDGRFPPLYVEGDNQSPYLDRGLPVVWASTISPYMSSFGSFSCPAASKEESTDIRIQQKDGPDTAHLEYGMYVPMASKPYQEVAKPEGTILIAETANMGAKNTFSPFEFQNSKSEVVPFNGFLIGWNNSNFQWDKSSTAVTHLAFYNTSGGVFDNDKTEGRHDHIIFALYANGGLGKLSPSDANVSNDSGNKLDGHWASK
ncbi:MAG: hypothetical protein JSS65_15115 [Armatimonadetes bacterium]|nr:hypothetical protein [Armatimonadota bacterium]